VKIQAKLDERTVILQTAEHYKAKVVDCSASSLILRVTGASEKLDSFITLLRPFGVVELVRSGKILMTRGPEAT
jgi:acetolactate synthase-1/3 small subunit